MIYSTFAGHLCKKGVWFWVFTSAIYCFSVDPNPPKPELFETKFEMEKFAKTLSVVDSQNPIRLPNVCNGNQVMASFKPPELLDFIIANPQFENQLLILLAKELSASSSMDSNIGKFCQSLIQHAGISLAAGSIGIREYMAVVLLWPERVVKDPLLKEKLMVMLEKSLSQDLSSDWKEQVLTVLNMVPGFHFGDIERLAYSWSSIPRVSGAREMPVSKSNPLETLEGGTKISLSVYSLPSESFSFEESTRFLKAVKRLAPNREVVVLSDLNAFSPFKAFCEQLGVSLIPTFGEGFSPWPRDPILFSKLPEKPWLILQRPNSQASRREDDLMARAMVHGLPDLLDCEWGAPEWGQAPTPFHNGKIIIAKDQLWINLDTVEIRTLEILGLDRVPIESFQSSEGISKYLEAANLAAGELAHLFGMPVAFLEPLPFHGDLERRSATMYFLGGSAGFDLDSLVTLLPLETGQIAAIVGDVGLGIQMIQKSPSHEIAAYQQGYGLGSDPERFRQVLLEYSRQARSERLGNYLDLIAGFLAHNGLVVERLPLFLVPTHQIENLINSKAVTEKDFLMTWQNVVIDRRGGEAFAEGFAGLLPQADLMAEAVFEKLGYKLQFLPPLLESIYRMGGYRCASKHIQL